MSASDPIQCIKSENADVVLDQEKTDVGEDD